MPEKRRKYARSFVTGGADRPGDRQGLVQRDMAAHTIFNRDPIHKANPRERRHDRNRPR